MFRTVCVKVRDTKQLCTNNQNKGLMPRIVKWLACFILSGSAIRDHYRIWPRQLRSPILSFSCLDLVNCGYVRVKITCYNERVCINWLCSCSVFLNFVILRALSQEWKSALCGRQRLSFRLPYVTFYRELNSASHFHDIQYIKSLQTAVKQSPLSWKSVNDRYALLKEFFNNEDGIWNRKYLYDTVG